MMRDVAYAIRSLSRSRGFAIVAILTLAIGIGASTAVYSVVDTILIRPLPFPAGDRLVRLTMWRPHPTAGRPPLPSSVTYSEFLDWQSTSKTLDDAMAAAGMAQRMVKTPDGAAGLWGAAVSPNAFATLKATAMLGRVIEPGDQINPDVVVISHDVWRLHYHADPSIIGRALEFRTGALLAPIPPRLLTVIGVMPATFQFPTENFDYFTPFVPDPSKQSPDVTMIARLADGISLQHATDEAMVMGAAIRPPWPEGAEKPQGPRFEIRSIKEETVAPLRPALTVLLATVAIVLLIVCANVANLMLTRATARQREIAVRLAVGASRVQIVRQVFAESIVLAVIGGTLGMLLGAAGISAVKELATLDAPGIFRLMFGSSILPRAHEIAINWRLSGIAFAISAMTCVVCALLPALHLSKTAHLHAIGSRRGGSHAASRLRASLVIGQLVMATVLLFGAGLLTSSFIRLSSFNKGYDPSQVLAFNLLFPDQYSSTKKADTIETLLQRFRAKAGVAAAGFARHGLLIGEELYIGRWVPPGRTLDEMRDARIRVRSVSDGFLTAMGVPVIEGRDLAASDTAAAPRVIVINRAMASRYFAGDPIGQVVDWHLDKSVFQATVAGVVEDLRQESATDEVRPEIFVDYRQYMRAEDVARPGNATRVQNEAAIGFLSFAVRTAGAPASLIPVVRDEIRAVDPNIGIDAIAPMSDLEASATARERFYAVMLGVFATIAALLAAGGIYGVLAYAVAQRTQEIGVRMALGARRQQVMTMILRHGLALAVAGVTIGLIGAAAGARYLRSMLFGIEPLDPWTFAQVAIMFTGVALLASYLPARRATGVDPVIALRHE